MAWSGQTNKQTPLHLAMKGDWFQLARILLDHGADANAEDIHGTTPLHLLSESQIHDDDALDLVWPLLGHGAVVETNKTRTSKRRYFWQLEGLVQARADSS
jgi:hypothetical protein